MASDSICKLIYGELSDTIFRKNSICLVTATNAITCKNFGHLKNLVSIYPYADIAGLRYTKPGCSYSCTRDRGVPGTTIINTPPQQQQADHPTIATIISQYGIGKPIETNDYAKRCVNYSRDEHHVRNLRNDTLDQRVLYFNSALNKLKQQLNFSEFNHIEYVMFPLGIARSGFIDEIWLTYYLPALISFSNELNGKTVCFVANEQIFSSLDNLFNRDDKLALLFMPLKQLEILHNFTDSSKTLSEILELYTYDIDNCTTNFLYNPPLHKSNSC